MMNIRKYMAYVLAIFVGLVLGLTAVYIAGGRVSKATWAEGKVAELAKVCETAAADYVANWDLATSQWDVDQQTLDSRHQLGELASPDDPDTGTEISVICYGNLPSLQAGVKNGDDPVPIYGTVEVLIRELRQIIDSPNAELQEARSAKATLEAVESYAYYPVMPLVAFPLLDAVSREQAQVYFDLGSRHLDRSWEYMARSEWGWAEIEALIAREYFSSALESASSPTPTP